MIDAFIDYLDSLNYEGYAWQLAQQNPERYKFELDEFLNNYGKPDGLPVFFTSQKKKSKNPQGWIFGTCFTTCPIAAPAPPRNPPSAVSSLFSIHLIYLQQVASSTYEPCPASPSNQQIHPASKAIPLSWHRLFVSS